VIANKGACTFVDAAGIHALLRSGDLLREGGARLIVRSLNPILLRLFEIVGVNGNAPMAVT
jgi:anti-anti-sigma regulatory factor